MSKFPLLFLLSEATFLVKTEKPKNRVSRRKEGKEGKGKEKKRSENKSLSILEPLIIHHHLRADVASFFFSLLVSPIHPLSLSGKESERIID